MKNTCTLVPLLHYSRGFGVVQRACINIDNAPPPQTLLRGCGEDFLFFVWYAGDGESVEEQHIDVQPGTMSREYQISTCVRSPRQHRDIILRMLHTLTA